MQRQIGDRTRHRLQQLDEREDDLSEHGGLSQEDYIRTIERIADELQQAWRLDQRVKALKIVIQVCFFSLLSPFLKVYFEKKDELQQKHYQSLLDGKYFCLNNINIIIQI